MGNPGDHGSGDAPDPASERCSFCLQSPSDAGTLLEGPERGELGRAYICRNCVELCASIFESREQEASANEIGDPESPIDAATQEVLTEKIDHALQTLTAREREIIKMRYGLSDGYTYTLEEVARTFEVTRERVRQIECRAIKKLQSRNQPPPPPKPLHVFREEE
jgi:RNA polymerase sigma factor (sigma-70 family)